MNRYTVKTGFSRYLIIIIKKIPSAKRIYSQMLGENKIKGEIK